jgi:hypothetical protein
VIEVNSAADFLIAKGWKIEPPRREGFPRDRIDPGILREVEILDRNGVETFESCQGGDGHAFRFPSVRFHGDDAAGWHALAVCFDHGLDVMTLYREWPVSGHIPNGPYWVIEFRRKSTP